MRDDRDYKVELSGAAGSSSPAGAQRNDRIAEGATASGRRPFLSVHFACCGVYQRIYRAPDGSGYNGRCPRCGKTVRFRIGEGGSDDRFFIVR